MMRHFKFYRILRRYVQGSLSEREKQRFDRFLDEAAPEDESSTWTDEEQAALLDRITKKIHAPVKKRTTTKQFVTAATLITVGLLAVYYVLLTLVLDPAGAEEEMNKIILSDGSLVWLKPGDKLAYTEATNGERHVTLSGEALFEVAKDPSRPFIVQCGATSLRVTGTSFTVRSVNDSVMLSVLTGSVHIYSSDDTTGIRVAAREAVAYAGRGPISGRTRVEALPEYVLKTEYNMRFNDATVEQLVARLEKKFDIHITVTNDTVNRCHITADFTDHSLDKTLTMLTEVLDITYTINGTTVIIQGTGCN